MKRLTPMTGFLVLAVLMHADVRGQESDAPPEMKPLLKMLGTWKVETIGKIPKETRPTTIHRRELVLGGRFIRQIGDFDDKGKPNFMGMFTYDSNKRVYRYWFFLSSGFYTDLTGTWDESSQTFTFKNRLPGDVTGTSTVRFLDETTYVWSMISRDAGGDIIFHLEGKEVRQK